MGIESYEGQPACYALLNIIIINDTCLCEDIDHVNELSIVTNYDAKVHSVKFGLIDDLYFDKSLTNCTYRQQVKLLLIKKKKS